MNDWKADILSLDFFESSGDIGWEAGDDKSCIGWRRSRDQGRNLRLRFVMICSVEEQQV
jgi:hypothetical protein